MARGCVEPRRESYPVLAVRGPADPHALLLGAVILLFGNAVAAYATAYALTSGSTGLVPIVIGQYYTGNVLSNPHLAQALAFGMFVVLAGMMLIYVPLQRRSARWMR